MQRFNYSSGVNLLSLRVLTGSIENSSSSSVTGDSPDFIRSSTILIASGIPPITLDIICNCSPVSSLPIE